LLYFVWCIPKAAQRIGGSRSRKALRRFVLSHGGRVVWQGHHGTRTRSAAFASPAGWLPPLGACFLVLVDGDGKIGITIRTATRPLPRPASWLPCPGNAAPQPATIPAAPGATPPQSGYRIRRVQRDGYGVYVSEWCGLAPEPESPPLPLSSGWGYNDWH
jgi:hypothetical protein